MGQKGVFCRISPPRAQLDEYRRAKYVKHTIERALKSSLQWWRDSSNRTITYKVIAQRKSGTWPAQNFICYNCKKHCAACKKFLPFSEKTPCYGVNITVSLSSVHFLKRNQPFSFILFMFQKKEKELGFCCSLSTLIISHMFLSIDLVEDLLYTFRSLFHCFLMEE